MIFYEDPAPGSSTDAREPELNQDAIQRRFPTESPLGY